MKANPMKHRGIKEKLFLLDDSTLSQQEKDQVVAHTEVCGECRKTFERLTKIHRALSSMPQPAPIPLFVEQVMQGLEPAETELISDRRFLFPRWVAPIVGYAFALVLMVMAIVSREAPIDTKSYLLADLPEGARWTFSYEIPDPQSLLATTAEEP